MSTKPVVLITGAAGGIGRALTAGFAAAGYAVTGVDRSAADGIVALDITDTAAVKTFAAQFETLAVLVNAAGILRHRDEYDIAVFEDVLDVNLTGAMRMATACEPALARAKGSIINIASMHAYFGAPTRPPMPPRRRASPSSPNRSRSPGASRASASTRSPPAGS